MLDPLAEDSPLSPWLPEELLEGELLLELDDELLLELLELLEELLDDELLLEEDDDGELVLGVEGVWGVVGLLALGHPASNRQAQASPASLMAGRRSGLFNVVRSDNFLRPDRLTRLEAGPESGFAQFPYQPVGLALRRVVFVHTLKVHHPAFRAYPEF